MQDIARNVSGTFRYVQRTDRDTLTYAEINTLLVFDMNMSMLWCFMVNIVVSVFQLGRKLRFKKLTKNVKIEKINRSLNKH